MEPLAYVPISEVAVRLVAAAGFSFLLGLDREVRQKSFGLRTHILLCMGTTAFVLALMEMMYGLQGSGDVIRIDPARIIQAIIIGISFLGAGSIIRSENRIHGATTGAGIWVVGSVGIACGLGLYLHAALITAFTLLVVVGMYPFDRWLNPSKKPAIKP